MGIAEGLLAGIQLGMALRQRREQLRQLEEQRKAREEFVNLAGSLYSQDQPAPTPPTLPKPGTQAFALPSDQQAPAIPVDASGRPLPLVPHNPQDLRQGLMAALNAQNQNAQQIAEVQQQLKDPRFAEFKEPLRRALRQRADQAEGFRNLVELFRPEIQSQPQLPASAFDRAAAQAKALTGIARRAQAEAPPSRPVPLNSERQALVSRARGQQGGLQQAVLLIGAKPGKKLTRTQVQTMARIAARDPQLIKPETVLYAAVHKRLPSSEDAVEVKNLGSGALALIDKHKGVVRYLYQAKSGALSEVRPTWAKQAESFTKLVVDSLGASKKDRPELTSRAYQLAFALDPAQPVVVEGPDGQPVEVPLNLNDRQVVNYAKEALVNESDYPEAYLLARIYGLPPREFIDQYVDPALSDLGDLPVVIKARVIKALAAAAQQGVDPIEAVNELRNQLVNGGQ